VLSTADGAAPEPQSTASQTGGPPVPDPAPDPARGPDPRPGPAARPAARVEGSTAPGRSSRDAALDGGTRRPDPARRVESKDNPGPSLLSMAEAVHAGGPPERRTQPRSSEQVELLLPRRGELRLGFGDAVRQPAGDPVDVLAERPPRVVPPFVGSTQDRRGVRDGGEA
jgi:hypothetical protein